MSANIIKLDSVEKLDAVFEESRVRPVAVFKHSNSCGISADVFEQLVALDGNLHVVVVQQNRDISNAVADRLGIRHASPQAFVLFNGQPVYHATHYGIEPDMIVNKLEGK